MARKFRLILADSGRFRLIPADFSGIPVDSAELPGNFSAFQPFRPSPPSTAGRSSSPPFEFGIALQQIPHRAFRVALLVYDAVNLLSNGHVNAQISAH